MDEKIEEIRRIHSQQQQSADVGIVASNNVDSTILLQNDINVKILETMKKDELEKIHSLVSQVISNQQLQGIATTTANTNVLNGDSSNIPDVVEDSEDSEDEFILPEQRVNEKRHDLKGFVKKSNRTMDGWRNVCLFHSIILVLWLSLSLALLIISTQTNGVPIPPAAASAVVLSKDFMIKNTTAAFMNPSSLLACVLIGLLFLFTEWATSSLLLKTVRAELFTRLVTKGCSTAELRLVEFQTYFFERLAMLRFASFTKVGPMLVLELLATVGSLLSLAVYISILISTNTVVIPSPCASSIAQFPLLDLSQGDVQDINLTGPDLGMEVAINIALESSTYLWRDYVGCEATHGSMYYCMQVATSNGYSTIQQIEDVNSGWTKLGPSTNTIATIELFCGFVSGPVPSSYTPVPTVDPAGENSIAQQVKIFTHITGDQLQVFFAQPTSPTASAANGNISCSVYLTATQNQNVLTSLSRSVVYDAGTPITAPTKLPRLAQAIISQTFSQTLRDPWGRSLTGDTIFKFYSDFLITTDYIGNILVWGLTRWVANLDIPLLQLVGTQAWSCDREVRVKIVGLTAVWFVLARLVCVVLVVLLPWVSGKPAPITLRRMGVSDLLGWLDARMKWADGCNVSMDHFSDTFYQSKWAVRERSDGHLTFMNDLQGEECTTKGYGGMKGDVGFHHKERQ